MTQKSNYQNSYAPLLPHGQSPHTQSLSWSELSELYDDFPDDLCDRFELIAPLYDDGICDELVTNELILHLENCSRCQEELLGQRILSEEFLGLRAELNINQVDISEAELEQSFQIFLKQQSDVLGEETNVDNAIINVNEPAQVAVKQPIAQPMMNIEYTPRTKLKLRHKAIFGLVSAAALLFAYGPALIETDIQESKFPEVSINQSSIHNEHDDLSFLGSLNTRVRSPLTKEEAELKHIKVNRSTTGQLTVATEWLYNNDQISARLSITPLSHQQAQQLVQKIKGKSEILTYSVGGKLKKQTISFNQVDQLQQLEYLTKLKHLQWSSTHPKSKQLLLLLSELQLSQD